MASSCSSVVMRCMGPSGALKTIAAFRARIADGNVKISATCRLKSAQEGPPWQLRKPARRRFEPKSSVVSCGRASSRTPRRADRRPAAARRLPGGAGARDRPRRRPAGGAWPHGGHRRRVRPNLLVRLLLRRPRRFSPGTLAVPLSRHRRRQLRMADLRRRRPDPSPRADHARRIPAREAVHQDGAAQGDPADAQRLPLLPLHPAVRSGGLRPAASISTTWSRSIAPSWPSLPRPAAPTCRWTRCRWRCCAIRWCASRPRPRAAIPTALLDLYVGVMRRIPRTVRPA